MYGLGQVDSSTIKRRMRACSYLTVAQLFLQDNFLLERPLSFDDIKPRLLGHWGTCDGINLFYANFQAAFLNHPDFHLVIGPGHGFPALQANLLIDGELAKVDTQATPDARGIAYICRHFSWPNGFPSHASPLTPHVICEGGELGYALATAYGFVLGQPQRIVAVLIGDGEFETATTLASLNLNKLLASTSHGQIIPVLHLNGYKISGPTIPARKSERELSELLRGFGFTPIFIRGSDPDLFQYAIAQARQLLTPSNIHSPSFQPPFLIFKTPKGFTGPAEVHGQKVSGNFRSHQIPLPHAKTDALELAILTDWLKSYRFDQLFNSQEGFTL